MIAFIIHWIRDACERPFGYLRGGVGLLALVLTPVCMAYMISSDPARLNAEDGVIETLSVVFWAMALLMCLWGLFHYSDRLDRLVFRWFSLLCSLAAARELDAQVLLNPRYFGRYGVHYRIDWFFSNKFHVSILLKLIWGAIFLAAIAFLLAPLFILRKPVLHLIRKGDTATGLFLIGVIGLAIGFICDDTLRGTHFISYNLRDAIEETAEMLGAIFFFAGVSCLLWKPASERIRVSEHET